MSRTAICIALLAMMNLFWAGSYAVIKYGLEGMDPLALVFWRLVFGLLILLAWISMRGSSLRLGRGDLFRISLAGLLLASSSLLTVTGIEMSNATDASLLYAFEPVWGIILASIILKERFLITTAAGLVLVLAGLVRLSGLDISAALWTGPGVVGVGNLIVVAGLLTESFFTIVLKPVAKERDAAVIFAGVLAVAVAALAVPVGVRGDLSLPASGRSLFAIAYLSVICTAMGYTLWVAMMRHIPVNVMLFTIFIQPVAGALIATFALGEAIDGRLIAGGALLMAGMAIAVVGHMRAAGKGRVPIEHEEAIASPTIQ